MLKGLGWTVVPFNPDRPLQFYPNCAIEEYPTDNGPADYALVVDGRHRMNKMTNTNAIQ